MPTTVQAVDAEQSHVVGLLVAGLPELVRALRLTSHAFHEQPRPGSQAEAAASDVDLRLPSDFTVFLVMAVDDYLDGFAALLEPRVIDGDVGRYLHRYAAYPLLRAAAEATAQAAWLVEPGLTPQARLQRSLAVWLYSAQQQLKLAPDHPTAAERIEKLRAKAAAYGFPEIPAPPAGGQPVDGAKLNHFGEARPSITDQFDKLAPNGDFLYRFLSAPTHSTLYGLIENSRALPGDTPGIAMSLTTVNLRHLLLITQGVLRLVDVTMGWWGTYAGYEHGTWLRARAAVNQLELFRLAGPDSTS